MTLDTTTPAAPVSSGSINSMERGGFTFASTEPIGDLPADLKGGTPATPADAKAAPATADADAETKAAEEGETEAPAPAAPAVEAKPAAPTAAEIGKKGGEATAAIKRHQAREAQKGGVPTAPKEEKAGAGADDAADDDPETAGKKATERVAAEIKAAPVGTKKQLASERVGEATRDARAARQELARERAAIAQERAQERQSREAERRELAELRQRVANPAPAQPKQGPAPTPHNGGRPAPAEEGVDPRDVEPLEDDPKYQGNWAPFFADHTKWTARKEARALIQKERATDAHQQKARSYADGLVAYVKTFEDRVQEAIKKDPDLPRRIPNFVGVIQNSSYVMPDGEKANAKHHINDAIIDSQRPALLMEYLKTTPHEVRRLLQIGNRDAIAREMVRLEARLELLLEDGMEAATAGNPASSPAVSKANPPVRPVTGPPAVTDELSDTLNQDEYFRRWNATVKPTLTRR